MTVTRRHLLISGLSSAALLAAGCGTSTPPTPDASAAGDPFPVTVAHKYGGTEILREPTRVVTVGLSDHDYVLALGVMPVAVTDWYGEQPFDTWPWAREALGLATPVLLPRNEDKLDLEKIAALRPDLVIGQYTGMTAADYAKVSRIAPTVAQSADFPDYRMTWQQTTRAIAAALGDKVLSGALTWSTVLSLPFAIDALTPMLAAALDGDPGTR